MYQLHGGRTHLHFEDDAIICRDFQTRALEVIRQYPDHLISLFHGMMKRTAGETEVRSAGTFTTTLALYIPPWFIEKETVKLATKGAKGIGARQLAYTRIYVPGNWRIKAKRR